MESVRVTEIDISSPKTSEEALTTTPISKRQLKKLEKLKESKKHREKRRALERERKKLKRKLLLEEGAVGQSGPSRKKLQQNKISKSTNKISVALDFSFDEYMNSRDIAKCVQQLNRCYSVNRRSPSPFKLYVVHLSGKSKEELQKHVGYQNWDLFLHSESYLELFPKQDLIYLTSDSENVLENLEENKVYIIGALVDHNSQKGLCYKIAKEQDIAHAQLPIGKFIQMKSRKVLTINQVYEILLKVSEGKTWKEAFLSAIPQRKGAEEKNSFDKTEH